MIQLNEENYQEEVKNSKIPVFVDHYADWCGPCKMLGPIYEKLEKSFKGISTDEYKKKHAERYDIPLMSTTEKI